MLAVADDADVGQAVEGQPGEVGMGDQERLEQREVAGRPENSPSRMSCTWSWTSSTGNGRPLKVCHPTSVAPAARSTPVPPNPWLGLHAQRSGSDHRLGSRTCLPDVISRSVAAVARPCSRSARLVANLSFTRRMASGEFLREM